MSDNNNDEEQDQLKPVFQQVKELLRDQDCPSFNKVIILNLCHNCRVEFSLFYSTIPRERFRFCKT